MTDKSLQPPLIAYFLMTINIAEFTLDHTVNVNVNVFYSTFTNVFYSCHVFPFLTFLILTSVVFNLCFKDLLPEFIQTNRWKDCWDVTSNKLLSPYSSPVYSLVQWSEIIIYTHHRRRIIEQQTHFLANTLLADSNHVTYIKVVTLSTQKMVLHGSQLMANYSIRHGSSGATA